MGIRGLNMLRMTMKYVSESLMVMRYIPRYCGRRVFVSCSTMCWIQIAKEYIMTATAMGIRWKMMTIMMKIIVQSWWLTTLTVGLVMTHDCANNNLISVICYMALDKPLWRLLAASGATHWWCMLNNNDICSSFCIILRLSNSMQCKPKSLKTHFFCIVQTISRSNILSLIIPNIEFYWLTFYPVYFILSQSSILAHNKFDLFGQLTMQWWW